MGFCTLYTFWAYPDKSRLRVSQILTLPPYQRQGVGHALLQAAYGIADSRGVLDIMVRPGAWKLCVVSLCMHTRKQAPPPLCHMIAWGLHLYLGGRCSEHGPCQVSVCMLWLCTPFARQRHRYRQQCLDCPFIFICKIRKPCSGMLACTSRLLNSYR